jgi:hypothetical protein
VLTFLNSLEKQAWSPGALSPADFTENADMTSFQMQELTQPAYKPKTDLPRTLQVIQL